MLLVGCGEELDEGVLDDVVDPDGEVVGGCDGGLLGGGSGASARGLLVEVIVDDDRVPVELADEPRTAAELELTEVAGNLLVPIGSPVRPPGALTTAGSNTDSCCCRSLPWPTMTVATAASAVATPTPAAASAA